MAGNKSDSGFGFSPQGLEQVGFTFLVSDVLKLIVEAVDEQIATLGLTKLQWATMVQVYRLDQPSQSELAKMVGVGRAAMGVAIDELETAGYVTRESDKKDRRIWRIHPTKMAMKRSRDIAHATERATNRIYSDVNSQELRDASMLFRKIIQNLV